MKPVLILGVGPAGLMAAHACKLTGVPFTIVSQGVDAPVKSRIGGAQFVHKAVPLLLDAPDGQLTYHVAGEAHGYQAKVYGEADVPFVSMQHVRDGDVIDVWSIQGAYDRLWDDIAGGGSSVTVATVTPQWLVDELEANRWRHVVSTIPRMALCLAHAGLVEGRPHGFVSQRVKIANECAFRTGDAQQWDQQAGEMNHVWYDGTKNVSWYRTSMIFGNGSTEWGEDMLERKLPYANTITVKKPISTDCQCFVGKVMFTGRYGAWKKGLLVHHAFVDTWRLLHPEALFPKEPFDVV